jgi:phospholipid/cholesterol/gamma-HCH transport system ATP-binding protein
MAADDAKSILRFEHVHVSFDGVPALVDISFEVSEGETRIILGAASSGKTVLLKTALGLAKPDSGSVYLFGQNITRMTEQQLFDMRSRAGMLFQESALFDSLTIEENVAYPLLNQKAIQCPLDEVEGKVKEALHFVELDRTLARFPAELSGGMRRRAAIARAVVTTPPLLLYDSPTAGLDPITAHTIMALIIKERDLSNTTTLIVTYRYQDGNLMANFRYNPDNGQLVPARDNGHRPQLRTKFIVLREGRLVFAGTQAELEASSDPYIAKFRRQTGG